MAYQLVKKPREIPAGSYENMDAPVSNTQAVRGAYGLEQPGLGDALEAQMQARMARFQSRQNPAAEAEADAVAAGITARTPAEVKAQLGEKMGADFSDVRFHTGADAVGKTVAGALPVYPLSPAACLRRPCGPSAICSAGTPTRGRALVSMNPVPATSAACSSIVKCGMVSSFPCITGARRLSWRRQGGVRTRRRRGPPPPAQRRASAAAKRPVRPPRCAAGCRRSDSRPPRPS